MRFSVLTEKFRAVTCRSLMSHKFIQYNDGHLYELDATGFVGVGALLGGACSGGGNLPDPRWRLPDRSGPSRHRRAGNGCGMRDVHSTGRRRDPPPETAVTGKLRILLVEDHRALAETTGAYLEVCGHEVDFASDGLVALHLAVTETYDVVVLDVMLPGVDGFAVCQRLREDAKVTTPIIMLTARDELADKLTGFDAGCRRLPGEALRHAGTGRAHRGAGAAGEGIDRALRGPRTLPRYGHPRSAPPGPPHSAVPNGLRGAPGVDARAPQRGAPP